MPSPIPEPPWQASQACFDLIKRYEDEPGFLTGRCSKLTAYKPTNLPTEPWTVGWGHTRDVQPGMTITPELADELLRGDVALVERDLQHLVRCPLTQGQADAVISLAFNVGARRLPVIAPKFWKALHAGDKQAAVVELVGINRAGGKVLAGLTERRKAEAALFLS